MIFHVAGNPAVSCCSCGRQDDDCMIGCDAEGCRFQWFHYECVDLDGEQIPDGEWFCKKCHPS